MKKTNLFYTFTWTKFITLICVILFITIIQTYLKKKTPEFFTSQCEIYGDIENDKPPKVPAGSLWAQVAKEAGFKPTPAIDCEEITPENCRIFNKVYDSLEEGDPQADDQLGSARMQCLMKYGEFSPQTQEGVDQYEKNVDQAFWTGHPSPL